MLGHIISITLNIISSIFERVFSARYRFNNNIVFDNDGNVKETDLVKLYYEMFLQANCTKHIISPWSGFSKLIATLSADDIIVVEDKNNPQFNIKIEGYTKLRLDEFLEII